MDYSYTPGVYLQQDKLKKFVTNLSWHNLVFSYVNLGDVGTADFARFHHFWDVITILLGLVIQIWLKVDFVFRCS